jgi:hypothetical protein
MHTDKKTISNISLNIKNQGVTSLNDRKKDKKTKDKSFLTSLYFYTFMFLSISADIFVPFVFFVLLIKNKEESTLMSSKGG